MIYSDAAIAAAAPRWCSAVPGAGAVAPRGTGTTGLTVRVPGSAASVRDRVTLTWVCSEPPKSEPPQTGGN